jgi:predicted membrane protein
LCISGEFFILFSFIDSLLLLSQQCLWQTKNIGFLIINCFMIIDEESKEEEEVEATKEADKGLDL